VPNVLGRGCDKCKLFTSSVVFCGTLRGGMEPDTA